MSGEIEALAHLGDAVCQLKGAREAIRRALVTGAVGVDEDDKALWRLLAGLVENVAEYAGAVRDELLLDHGEAEP